MKRKKDQGVSLLNVLVVVAAGAGLVQVMLSSQGRALDRLSTARDLSQARALAEGGITSVAIALRRDLIDAPDSDHQGEEWAQAAQKIAQFEFGNFAIEIEDLRGRFDLNSLEAGGPTQLSVFEELLVQLDLPKVLGAEIVRIIAADGLLASPEDLRQKGISDTAVEKLKPHVTALPVRHNLNLNAADRTVMSAMFRNDVAADGLLSRRSAKGSIDQSDLAAIGLVLPPLSGFSSDAFSVEATAEVGISKVVVKRVILRDGESGEVEIIPGN